MESLTVKGLQMQYTKQQQQQQKQQHQQQQQRDSFRRQNSVMTTTTERETITGEKREDVAIVATLMKNSNYKDVPSGNTITDSNPLIVDYHHRKTSAEIVSEAKTLLAAGGNNIGIRARGNGSIDGERGVCIISNNNSNTSINNVGGGSGNINIGGARLVSTRRPITPREPRRQLYGKLAPPGRPPSAFSLRYLQFESRALPSLEPIQSSLILNQSPSSSASSSSPASFDDVPFVPRSGSIGTLLDDYTDKLLLPPTLSSSSSLSATSSITNVSEEISPYPSELYRRKSESNTLNSSHNKIPLKEIQKNIGNEKDTSIFNRKCYQQMITKQIKSFDIPLKSTSIELSMLNEEDDDDNDDNIDKRNNEDENAKDTNKTSNNNENVLMVKKRLTRSNDLLAQSSTETLLDLLKAHSGIKECNEETVQHINAILVELYSRLKGAKGNCRSAILGGLYGLVECSSPKILLAVARVVLALRVTGSNLTGACKLVFKVARNETNDHLFIDTDVPELLIDGLGRASPMEEPEACIYGYGAVRFLANAGQCSSANNANQLSSGEIMKCSSASCGFRQKSLAQRLARHGAVQLMVLHLQMLNEAGSVQRLTGSSLHTLYQLSAALRALAGMPQIFSNVKSTSPLYMEENEISFPLIKETSDEQEIQLELACPHLVKAAEISTGEPEIQANIVRTLSILSENEACCECLSQFTARIGILLGPCDEMINGIPDKQLTLLSRLGYTLGNIVARYDEARIQLYENDVAMQYILETLNVYSKHKFTIRNQMDDTVIDVLIKLVRVIANMSVNANVGYGLASRSMLGKILLHSLLTVNNTKESKINSELEELQIAILGALHNLSFYQDNNEGVGYSNETDKSGSMCSLLAQFSITLCNTLEYGNEMSKIEAARVLGNMTRNLNAREAFCSNGGLKTILDCLKSDDYELIATSSGVLVNLLGDWKRRLPFRELKGPSILYEILQKSTKQEDWLLSTIVCQALWNFLIDNGNVIDLLSENEADYFANELAEYLDEEKLFKNHEPNILWEQFAAVATDLLEKIQISLSIEDDDKNVNDKMKI